MRMKKTSKHINQVQAAQLSGVVVTTFALWLNGKNPPPRDSEGYPTIEFGEWLRDKAARDAGFDPENDGRLDVQQERGRKESAMADKYERENRIAEGTLIAADTIRAALETMLMRVKTRLLKIPSSVAPMIVGVMDNHVIQETIDDAVRDALTELSAGLPTELPV